MTDDDVLEIDVADLAGRLAPFSGEAAEWLRRRLRETWVTADAEHQ